MTRRQPKIMVIGDYFADRTIFYRTERESPEGGHPVVRQVSEIAGPGGAGAVAAMCRALGAVVVEIGGHWPRQEKCRHVVDSRAVFRVDGPLPPIGRDAGEHSDAAAIRRTEVDAIVVADHGKGAVTERVFSAAVAASREQEIPLLVDPWADRGGNGFGFYAGATAIFPNRNESRAKSLFEAADIAVDAIIATEASCCCVKMDAEGYVAWLPMPGGGREIQGNGSHCPPDELVDPSGAGDQFIAGVAVAICRGESWSTALAYGNRLAGMKCRQWGATPATGQGSSRPPGQLQDAAKTPTTGDES